VCGGASNRRAWGGENLAFNDLELAQKRRKSLIANFFCIVQRSSRRLDRGHRKAEIPNVLHEEFTFPALGWRKIVEILVDSRPCFRHHHFSLSIQTKKSTGLSEVWQIVKNHHKFANHEKLFSRLPFNQE
jgi:hypothetical protein